MVKTGIKTWGRGPKVRFLAISTPAFYLRGDWTSRSASYPFTLYNYRARTYDPVEGRIKQIDPIGLDGGAGLYA
jgi:hypothetical protein